MYAIDAGQSEKLTLLRRRHHRRLIAQRQHRLNREAARFASATMTAKKPLTIAALPSDIMYTISTHLPQDDMYASIHNLFHMFAAQKRIYNNALTRLSTQPGIIQVSIPKTFSLQWPHFLTVHVKAYAQLLDTQLTSIAKCIEALIQASLQHATLSITPTLIPVLDKLRPLRKLCIGGVTSLHIPDIYKALCSLRLSALTLQCANACIRYCNMAHRLWMNVTSHGSVCPKLTYLDIDCPCDREIISYVRLMHTFPVLEHVCLQGDLSFSTSLTFVTTVRKIHLRGVNIPWRLRKYIISFTPRVPLFKDIPTILAAKKMECVHVTIGRRTEMAFAQYAELFKVKSLRVTWGRDGTRRYIPGFLYRANVGMPSRIATSCNVTDLALNNVWICPGELALILEQHGPILKRFEFSVVGQYEGIVGQMIRLLKDVLMYCADLRVLLAYDIDRAFEEVCMGGFFVEKEDREVLKDCVERMKRDRWWLEWKDIRKLCERIVATPEPDSS